MLNVALSIRVNSIVQQSFGFEQETTVAIASGAFWLRGFCLPIADALLDAVTLQCKRYPPQTMMTPMGYPMSVKTTSFGQIGWQGDTNGYGYVRLHDNEANDGAKNIDAHWADIPKEFLDLAQAAASRAGYQDFLPDTCLLNIYAVGAKMGLHQDKDEHDFTQPIVSVSLGIPAIFLFGGPKRSDKTVNIPVVHGDVIVWGGESRRYFHGVNKVPAASHPVVGAQRINLTFRKAL